MSSNGISSATDAEYCLTLLRENAPDLYFSCLLLPKRIRAAVAALHAFHTEITGFTLAASEPMTGEIRLQWWMDVLNGGRGEEARQNPLARSLLATIAEHNLPVQVLVRKLEAHVFDLYNDPMGNRATLEGYLGETRSALFQLAGIIANVEQASAASDASGHAGVATGYTAILENMALHRSHQKVFVPEDMLAACSMTSEDFLSNKDGHRTELVVALVDAADRHGELAKSSLAAVSGDVRWIFAPLAVVPVYLKRIKRNPERVFTGLPAVSQLKRQWALWRWR